MEDPPEACLATILLGDRFGDFLEGTFSIIMNSSRSNNSSSSSESSSSISIIFEIPFFDRLGSQLGEASFVGGVADLSLDMEVNSGRGGNIFSGMIGASVGIVNLFDFLFFPGDFVWAGEGMYGLGGDISRLSESRPR
jgi:hypothetical protein